MLAASLPKHGTKLYTVQLATFKWENTEVEKILKISLIYFIIAVFWVNLSSWGGCHDRIIMNKALFDSHHQIEHGNFRGAGGIFSKKASQGTRCLSEYNKSLLPYIGHLPLFENINIFQVVEKQIYCTGRQFDRWNASCVLFWKYPLATTQGELDMWDSTSSCESLFSENSKQLSH